MTSSNYHDDEMIHKAGLTPAEILIAVDTDIEGVIHTHPVCHDGTRINSGKPFRLNLTDLRADAKICKSESENYYIIDTDPGFDGLLLGGALYNEVMLQQMRASSAKTLDSPDFLGNMDLIHRATFVPWAAKDGFLSEPVDQDSIWQKALERHRSENSSMLEEWTQKVRENAASKVKEMIRSKLQVFEHMTPQQVSRLFEADQPWYLFDTDYLIYLDYDSPRLNLVPGYLSAAHRVFCFIARTVWGTDPHSSIVRVPLYAAECARALGGGAFLLEESEPTNDEVLEILNALAKEDEETELSEMLRRASAI